MKRIFLLLIVVFCFIPDSCKKEPIKTCGMQNPEVSIPWLKSYLSQTSYENVYKVTVGNDEYIAVTRVGGLDAIAMVFDCSGNLICKAGDQYIGDNTCYFLNSSWDSIYQKRILIYEKRE